MFKKKITLFGRAVPISLVALLVTATLAGAVWGGILTFSSGFLVNTTQDNADTINRLNDACVVVSDNPTGVDPTFCDALVDVNDNVTINIESASPGDRYQASSSIQAPSSNSNILFAQPLDVTPWGTTLDLVADNGCGISIQPGTTVTVSVTFDFDADGQDTDPSSSYGPFPIVRDFSEVDPGLNCP